MRYFTIYIRITHTTSKFNLKINNSCNLNLELCAIADSIFKPIKHILNLQTNHFYLRYLFKSGPILDNLGGRDCSRFEESRQDVLCEKKGQFVADAFP